MSSRYIDEREKESKKEKKKMQLVTATGRYFEGRDIERRT